MIVGIIGDMGSGKTLLMTRYAVKDREMGRNIYANYGLKNIEYTKLDMEALVKNELDLQNASVFIDEITVYMDARSSMGNRALSYFVLQTRKRSVCLYYTTQRIQMLDRRLREHTQILIECFESGKPGYRTIKIRDFRKGNWAPIRKLFPIEAWYPFYDTNEVISPLKRVPHDGRVSSKSTAV